MDSKFKPGDRVKYPTAPGDWHGTVESYHGQEIYSVKDDERADDWRYMCRRFLYEKEMTPA